jgi:Na+/H+-dicarboxylate symporter
MAIEFDPESGRIPRYSCRLTNSLISIDDCLTRDQQESQINDGPKSCGSKFCNYYGKHQLGFVILGATSGIVLGIGLAYWTPENPDAKETTLLWIGLLGQLFIRALRCIILPLIFSSITISVMDMLAFGKAGKIVGHTICLYLLTTICAACVGVLTSLAFSTKYNEMDNEIDEQMMPEVKFACSIDAAGSPTSFLTEMNDGSVICANGEATDESLFLMQDVNGYYATSAAVKGVPELSMSENFYQGLFMKLIGPNMVGLFVDNNFLGVIVLAVSSLREAVFEC